MGTNWKLSAGEMVLCWKAVGQDGGSMALCSAKIRSSLSLLALCIYFFMLQQFCILDTMTAPDFEMMLERKLQPLVTSLGTLTRNVYFSAVRLISFISGMDSIGFRVRLRSQQPKGY